MSFVLSDLIKETLEAGSSVLLFHNRKGWGKRFVCINCGAECFYPDSAECPFCKSLALKSKSLGTEKFEFWIKKNFPNFPVLRIEGTVKKPPAIKKASAIIATQSLFSFPALSLDYNIGLVSIVAKENNFLAKDFRRLEKEALLLARLEEWANGVEARHFVVQHWEPIQYDEKQELEWREKLRLGP